MPFFHGKGGAVSAGQTICVQSGLPQCILHTLTAGYAGGGVLLATADIHDIFAAMLQHLPGQVAGGRAVVVINAGQVCKTLPRYHHRHTAVFQRLAQLRAGIIAQQDDTGHMVALQRCKIFQLHLPVQLGVCQQHQVAAGPQLGCNAAGDLPHRLGADAGHNDPHLTHLAGAQGLRRSIRAVAGLFHYGLYHGALLLAEGAAVQIAADRSAGNACHLCNITDGHEVLFSVPSPVVMCKRFHAYYKSVSYFPQEVQ